MCENTYEKYMMEYQKALDETYGYTKDREILSGEEVGWALKEIYKNFMRSATKEEREGINDYIKSISHPIKEDILIPIKKGDILIPIKNDIHTMPCNLKGCDAITRASCCGCPEQLEWEKENENQKRN